MATTVVQSGSLSLLAVFTAALSVEKTGAETARVSLNLTFSDVGGTEPDVYTWFRGIATCAAGDWLLAHASDPLQGMGSAAYCESGAPRAGTDKLKLLYIKNTDTTNSISIARGAAAGLPIFDAASDAITLRPGGVFLFYDSNGAGAATLTTTSNDKLTIAVGGGSPTAEVVAVYGP